MLNITSTGLKYLLNKKCQEEVVSDIFYHVSYVLLRNNVLWSVLKSRGNAGTRHTSTFFWGNDVPPLFRLKELKHVYTNVDSLPVSTADYERGFGTRNRIMTPMRNSLSASHLCSLMFININGPPLEMQNLKDYLKPWFKHHRHADDTRSRIFAQHWHASNRHVDLWKIF